MDTAKPAKKTETILPFVAPNRSIATRIIRKLHGPLANLNLITRESSPDQLTAHLKPSVEGWLNDSETVNEAANRLRFLNGMGLPIAEFADLVSKKFPGEKVTTLKQTTVMKPAARARQNALIQDCLDRKKADADREALRAQRCGGKCKEHKAQVTT